MAPASSCATTAVLAACGLHLKALGGFLEDLAKQDQTGETSAREAILVSFQALAKATICSSTTVGAQIVAPWRACVPSPFDEVSPDLLAAKEAEAAAIAEAQAAEAAILAGIAAETAPDDCAEHTEMHPDADTLERTHTSEEAQTPKTMEAQAVEAVMVVDLARDAVMHPEARTQECAHASEEVQNEEENTAGAAVAVAAETQLLVRSVPAEGLEETTHEAVQAPAPVFATPSPGSLFGGSISIAQRSDLREVARRRLSQLRFQDEDEPGDVDGEGISELPSADRAALYTTPMATPGPGDSRAAEPEAHARDLRAKAALALHGGMEGDYYRCNLSGKWVPQDASPTSV